MEGIEPDPRRHRRTRRQRQNDAAEHQRHDGAEQQLIHGPPPVRKRRALVTGEHGRPQNGRGSAHWWRRMVSKGLKNWGCFETRGRLPHLHRPPEILGWCQQRQNRGRNAMRLLVRVMIASLLAALPQATPARDGEGWVVSCTGSAQGPYPIGNPSAQPDQKFAFPDPATGARDQTFRLMVRPDLWGRQARIRLSNAFGKQPVTFDGVYVGLQS